jgi:hypothetical protein
LVRDIRRPGRPAALLLGDVVAAETGLDPRAQVAAARAALAALALEYESVAFAGVVEGLSPRATLPKERRPRE